MVDLRRQYTFDTGPVMYHLGIDRAHPNVLSGGSPGRISRIADYLDVEDLVESDRGLVSVHGTYEGIPVTAFSSGMGPASVSITLPEVIEACDHDEMIIIRLGTSGGLQPYLNIGDFVATTWVERAESTSDKIQYAGYHAVADDDVRMALVKAAGHVKQPYQEVYEGPTRVTDDIYFDAQNSRQRDHVALAVSMEFSVFCALRDRYNRDQDRNIRAGNLLVVSDNVVAETEHIDMTEFQKRLKEIETSHIHAGLEALVELHQ